VASDFYHKTSDKNLPEPEVDDEEWVESEIVSPTQYYTEMLQQQKRGDNK
jgi:hypothetical protein